MGPSFSPNSHLGLQFVYFFHQHLWRKHTLQNNLRGQVTEQGAQAFVAS